MFVLALGVKSEFHLIVMGMREFKPVPRKNCGPK